MDEVQISDTVKRLGEYRDRVGRGGGEGVRGRTKRNLRAAETPIYRRGPSARKVTPLPHTMHHAPYMYICATYTPVRVAPVPR